MRTATFFRTGPYGSRKPILIAVAAMALSNLPLPAASQTARAEILGDYPCAANLPDSGLSYLRDWANATANDPCLLDPAAFASTFGAKMAMETAEGAGEQAYIDTAIDHVREYFRNQRQSALWTYQVLTMGRDVADGVWGPNTESKFRAAMETYTAIGGSGEGWGVHGPHDVPRFLFWIQDAEFAIATGGEFPD